MMIEVVVPNLSESVTEGTLLKWHKAAGSAVKQGENLVDIETDKVVLEIPATHDGVLAEIVKANGSVVKPGELLARINTSASAVASKASAEPASAPAPLAKTPSATISEEDNEMIMPAARRLIEENGINPSVIKGTGRGGRITKEDVQNYLNSRVASATTAVTKTTPTQTSTGGVGNVVAQASLPQPPSPVNVDDIIADRPEQRVPMTRLRARVAERLVQSQSTAAILTTFNEVNMQPVMDLRNRYKDKFEKEHGVKLGFMSFFVKAAVHALKRYPVVNASVDGNDMVYHGYFDIGIAVGSPRGLVVPILRNAEHMNLADIEKKIADFGKRAGEGKLGIEELTGGTFTISNGGVFGSMLSTPIINPPQSAILGVHATKDRPVVENGQIVIRPMNYLALSYDHRIIDGREAVLSLVAMKEALEDPARLLLEV